MSDPGTPRVATDVMATWWNLPRAVEVDGDTFYGGISRTGVIKVVAIT